MEKFRGHSVMGSCDADFYVFWCFVKLFEDSFGPQHPVLFYDELRGPWLSFVNALDDFWARSFFDEGFVSSMEVILYSD